MTPEQSKFYNDYLTSFKKNTYCGSDEVKRLILRDIKYPNLFMINPELMVSMDDDFEEQEEIDLNQVYVFAGFMRPGRQLFTVIVPDVNLEQQTVEL